MPVLHNGWGSDGLLGTVKLPPTAFQCAFFRLSGGFRYPCLEPTQLGCVPTRLSVLAGGGMSLRLMGHNFLHLWKGAGRWGTLVHITAACYFGDVQQLGVFYMSFHMGNQVFAGNKYFMRYIERLDSIDIDFSTWHVVSSSVGARIPSRMPLGTGGCGVQPRPWWPREWQRSLDWKKA